MCQGTELKLRLWKGTRRYTSLKNTLANGSFFLQEKKKAFSIR